MKKALLVLFMLAVCLVCYADNAARIKELTDENTRLVDMRQQHMSMIQRIEVIIVENNGAIKELQRQDEDAKKKKEEKCEQPSQPLQ